MADFGALIRLKKWELDEKRRMLAALEDEREQIENKIRQIETDISNAGQGVDVEITSMTLGPYLEACRSKIKQLRHELDVKREEIDALQEEVFAAFQDLKSVEIAFDKFTERLKREEARKETLAADEAGLQGFIRKTGA